MTDGWKKTPVKRRLGVETEKKQVEGEEALTDRGMQTVEPGSVAGLSSIDAFRKAASNFKWIGIGVDTRYEHGSVEPTGVGAELIAAATQPDPPRSGVINPARAPLLYGQLVNCPQTAAAVQRSMEAHKADFRSLAIKVALMDDQRERRFVQTTGVETFEWGLRNGGVLHTGQNRDGAWCIGAPGTQVIGIPENVAAGSQGREAWILSHLAHPLAWVFDKHEVTKLGSEESSEELFVRTSGFPVAHSDHRFDLPANAPILVQDMDLAVGQMIYGCLRSETSLRRAFEAYASPMLTAAVLPGSRLIRW
ncbi:hypothetical protein M0802_012920 [Mischocyttarus mexicanus]|nr:hypothetical protein M0802_012920 [Mischocyttarus mexicanus]